MSSSRWHQDIEVAEFIQHMKQDDKRDKEGSFDWSRLTKGEERIVLKELDRIQQDFVYAARNYFWITNKNLQDQLLTLIPAQELILQKILEIKRKGKAQRIMIIKGRQLGCSTLIEALIAYRTMFFSNVNAIVVSYDRPHTADVLYPIMTTILDKLPWWLRPMVASRKNDEGIYFDNPKADQREEYPGLVSRVYVKAANTTTAVGMGIRLSAAHISEYASFDEKTARTIIDQDMRHALIDSPDTFAILESTAKGANNYTHKLWKTCVQRAEKADWYPLFLPAFFEPRRVIAPPQGWKIEMPEYRLREKVMDSWLRCDNKNCRQYHMRHIGGEDRSGTICTTCNEGTVHPYKLSDAQCVYMEYGRVNSQHDDESTKKFKQEICVWTEERISTEFGILKLSDPDAIRSTNLETGRKINYLDNGIHQCVRLRTAAGRELVVTPEHLIETEKGQWVEAANSLNVKVKLSPPRFVSEPYTVRWNILPGGVVGSVVIDEKWARFLGYFMGDGCYRGSGVEFACDIKDQDVVQDIASLCEYITGNTAILTHKRGMTLITSHDIRWRPILLTLGCLKLRTVKQNESLKYKKVTSGYARKVCVPECIFRSPKHVVKEFISALFECDGHAYKDAPKTAFFSKHEQFCRDIQLLLLGFGINGRIYLARKLANWNGQEYMGQDLRLNARASNLFNKEIGFVGARKRSGCHKEKLGQNAQRHEMLDVIVSITDAGERTVADVTIQDTHKFGASGVMVHNCITPTDAFQLEGYQIFGAKAQDFADSCVRDPIAIGDYDIQGYFHGVNHENPRWLEGPTGSYKGCYQKDCTIDHRWTENPCQIWEWPKPGHFYCMGADVSEGLGGKTAYSAAVMNKYSHQSEPNEQVATWRSNSIDPMSYAGKLNAFGRHYNDAMAAVEVNRYDTCLNTLRFDLNYPNIYRWKNMDSLNPMSNKLGWLTNLISRPRLWMTLRLWLQQELFMPRSQNVVDEMRNFVKEDMDDVYAAGDRDETDDELIGAMISLYCANETLHHDGLGLAMPRSNLTPETAKFYVLCRDCGHKENEMVMDEAKTNPMMSLPITDAAGQIHHEGGLKCRRCGSLQVEVSRNPITVQPSGEADRWLSELHGGNNEAALINPDLDANLWQEPDYDSL